MEFNEVTTLMNPKPWTTPDDNTTQPVTPGAMVGYVRVTPAPPVEMTPELANRLWNGVTCTVKDRQPDYIIYEVSVPTWYHVPDPSGNPHWETNRRPFEEVVQMFFRRFAAHTGQ